MRLVVALAMIAVAVGSYLLTPLFSAYQIRQAIRAGDTSLLENLVEWPAVRASLKSSLAEIERRNTEHANRHGMPSPSLWSRVKAAASAGIADRMIDQVVTPAGIVQMHQARASLKQVAGAKSQQGPDAATSLTADALDPSSVDTEPSALTRLTRFWQRIKRAEFKSPSLIELEVADRKVPERSYVGTMEFRGLGWKLTRLEIQGAGF